MTETQKEWSITVTTLSREISEMINLLKKFNCFGTVIPNLSHSEKLTLIIAIEHGYIKDVSPRYLGTSACWFETYQLKPKGRLYIKKNSPD